MWVLTRTCGCSRRVPGPGVIWHQWPSPRPPSQTPSARSFICSLASSRPKLNHNRIMRSDNRARSRRIAREAASNPPPLRHLAHYLSIFVFLSPSSYRSFSLFCVLWENHCFINNNNYYSSTLFRRICINKSFTNKFLYFCKVHNKNCILQSTNDYYWRNKEIQLFGEEL